MYYSINWKYLWRRKDIIGILITFLDESGNVVKKVKQYREWIGISTNNIEKVVSKIEKYFPGNSVYYFEITQVKKALPYFLERLEKQKLDYISKPFYKVYTTASHKNVGRLFNCYKVTYFDTEDWLIRIYVDLCIRYHTTSFYYKWYNFRNNSQDLMKSLEMIPDCIKIPDWTVAAFDIESVPLKGDHIPLGHQSTDLIVMLSVYKWNKRNGIKKWILYLLPKGCQPLSDYEHAFESESKMLIKFHSLLDDAQILTGYNVNAFDFPCIFARLTWHNLKKIINRYSSAKIGSSIVASYNDKPVIDLYPYFKTFSNYGLPSYKLDDVAQRKLEGESKIQVKSTGIWSWYRNDITKELLEETTVEECFNIFQPKGIYCSDEFGTFRTYLDYCLKDSELVYKLYEKETVLNLLISRANISPLNAVQVLHLGNSRYSSDIFKTYALCLGFLVNPKFFNNSNESKFKAAFEGKTYQGALNYCVPKTNFENVSVMDFASMYPSTLVSSNLCYGTCAIMSTEDWLANEAAQKMTTIPYRQHSDIDFTKESKMSEFAYPTYDPTVDKFVIVINTKADAFLPCFVKHFIEMRQHHQKEYKRTKNVYHKNVQLSIKILINSLYGVMANKDSPLAYLPIAMSIVTLSRYQLLGSYHYVKNKGYHICYADTDSLMVQNWSVDNCDEVNAFLNIPGVELKYEQRMKRLLVLSKKRYLYEEMNNSDIKLKGFQKKSNGLIDYMTNRIKTEVWDALFKNPENAIASKGWIIWTELLQNARYECRNPKKYSIYRKIKSLDEYKSLSCPAVKFLKKYPDKTDEHVEYTYSLVDLGEKEESNWIIDVKDCQLVNYEKLFISQKKIFCMLLNIAFWKLSDPTKPADMVLNSQHWLRFVNAELLHWQATGRGIVMFTEPGVRYTFKINEHLFKERNINRIKELLIELYKKETEKNVSNDQIIHEKEENFNVDSMVDYCYPISGENPESGNISGNSENSESDFDEEEIDTLENSDSDFYEEIDSPQEDIHSQDYWNDSSDSESINVLQSIDDELMDTD